MDVATVGRKAGRPTLKSAVAGLWWGSPRLRCPYCDRDMKNEHSLNVHVSRYHNQSSMPSAALCPVCRKTYSNQYSLRTHMHLQAQDFPQTSATS
jgi:hypothetical protein